MEHPKKRQSIFIRHKNKIFLICITLATLLLGIGYAQLTQQSLFINADADTTPLEEVVITSVTSSDISVPVYTSNSVNSTVTLSSSDPTDTASMTITVYNNSDINQYFLGANHDSGIGYTNQGIVYTISGIEEEELITPGGSKTFTVTFSYKDGQLQSSNTLTSFIQYNFSPLSSMSFSVNNSYSDTYAGNPISPSGVTVSTPSSGVEIKYGTTEGTYDSSSVPTFTEVGTHTIYYQIKAEGYLTERGSYTFTIEKATPVIVLSSNTGTVVEGNTMTFTATVRSGATNGNAAGTLSISSGTTTVATISPASSNITATPSGLATTVTVTGITNGTSTITIGFTPGDTDNYNTPTSVTYTAEIVKSATIPTNTLCVSRTYTGVAQNLTSVTSGTGYTLSNYNQTNAGEYTITATLVEGYRWNDNDTNTKTFTCSMSKATPVITLSTTSGDVEPGSTSTFIATVSSGSPATTTGTLSASSSATSYATVSPTSSNVTANTSGIATTETITGVAEGNSTITVSFTPTDSTNFNNAVSKTYSVTVITNYLMIGTYGEATSAVFGNSNIERQDIEEIHTLTNKTVPNNAIEYWDVSAAQNGSVIAYTLDDDNDGLYELYIGQKDGVRANVYSSSLFANFTNATTIDLNNFDTSSAIDMSYLFNGCSNLTSLDLGDYFDTSSVTNMYFMFNSCSSLTSLDLGDNFDTSSVTNMIAMFNGCSSLESLDLGDNFDTSEVTSMGYMFSGCTDLESLDLGDNFDTSAVIEMNFMFNGCNSLESLDLGDYFNTDSVTTMAAMFGNCSSLTSLDLGDNFDTSSVTDMYFMFYGCTDLVSLDLGDNFNTSSVTTMSQMFNDCSSLTSLDLGDYFDTSSVTNMSYMFAGCSSLTSLDLGDNFDTSSVTNMYFMFNGCTNLASLDLGDNFDTTSLTTAVAMFSGCSSLESLDLGDYFDTSSVTNMSYMFNGCSSLESLDLGDNFDTSSVTDMSFMFSGDSSLISLDLGDYFDTSSATNMVAMFSGDSSLTSLNLGDHFKTSSVTNMNYMFNSCSSLTSLDLRDSFDTSSVTSMAVMFNNCTNLTTIYTFRDFVSTNVTDSTSMFADDTNLVGGNGTTYNSAHTDHVYAVIDTPSTPGYFTKKEIVEPIDNLTYNGSTQALVNSDRVVYYSLTTQLNSSNYESLGTTTIPTGTNAGDYVVYWYYPNIELTGSTTTTISKATPVITLSATSGDVYTSNTTTFVATVASGTSTTAAGTLSANSSNTSYATVSPTSTNITANTSGIATTETITGVVAGTATITVSFIPTDTTNFNNAINKTYSVTVLQTNLCIDGDYLNECLIYNDAITRVYSDAISAINSKTASNFSTVSTTDEGLKAVEDYSSVSSTTLDGTSYYYRGAVEDNWVSFAGYLWRVVRINGDGSVRLIYSGTIADHTGIGTQIGTSTYNTIYDDPKYVGYTYDNNGTETDSTIKTSIDSWYATNIKPSYEGYLSNEIFCNDRSTGPTVGGTTYYGANTRLQSNKTPSLLCTNQTDRYTLKTSGQSSISGTSGAGNNLLDYPVGLLTADEASLAGGKYGTINQSYYLYTGQYYWLGSPRHYEEGGAAVFGVNSSGGVGSYYVYGDGDVRPVLNLKSSVRYASGDGTVNNPYVLKQEPYVSLSSTGGSVNLDATSHFTVTVYSGLTSDLEGTLTINNSDTSVVTLDTSSVVITATPSGKTIDIAVTGISSGSSTITIGFIPTNTSYGFAESKTYIATVSNPCTSGDTLKDCLIYADYGARDYNSAVAAISRKTASDFSVAEDSDYGLKAIADYSSISSTTLDGTSYYYRGAVEDNWVSFAGYLWRVVRINGDGSVRMIYSGTTSNHTGTGTQIGTSDYTNRSPIYNNIGYTFKVTSGGVTTDVDSNIKSAIDNWYANNIDRHYDEYISNESYCSDRTYFEYNGSPLYYGAALRLTPDSVISTLTYYEEVEAITPSLVCARLADRYTLKVSGSSNIPGIYAAGNNLLDYPVGLLTADEFYLAGAGNSNNSYLYTGQDYWLNSPATAYSYGSYSYAFSGSSYTSVYNVLGVRPVLNLKSSVKYAGGRGIENDPYVIKQEPFITLNDSRGSVSPSNTTTFTATVYSGGINSSIYDIEGTISATSSDPGKATVSASSSSITATNSGTPVVITVTGVALGSSIITVTFTPTDANYDTISKTYIATTRNDYTVTFDANSGTFTNSNSTNTLTYPNNYLTVLPNVTKYSHTSNIDDTGLKLSNYGNNWTNANITGTDRGDTSKAHVVTIPGATSLTVDIYYNGQNTSYDWVTVWAGSHPDYTAANNYNSTGTVASKLGGGQSGSYTVNGNSLTNMGHSTLTIGGDTVTFGFKSNASGYGNGYGYYAIITNNGPIESVTYTGTYEEPTRDGYDFFGWLSSEDGNIYDSISGESLRPDADITYTAQWGHYIAIPNNICATTVYNGSEQVITVPPETGYSFSDNVHINSGYHKVTINLDPGYLWVGNSSDPVSRYCYISSASSNVTLSTIDDFIEVGETLSFTVTVTSDVNSAGTLSVSSDTNTATVSPSTSNIIATPEGVTITGTVTGVAKGKASLSFGFTPDDTRNFGYTTYARNDTLYVIGINKCVEGDTLSNCLVYNDYGARDYNAAITAIGNKAASDFSSHAIRYEGLKSTLDYSSINSSTLDGVSYYYRGDIRDNWISFGGFLWRIVRINGDGSIRMIYSGTTSNHTGTGSQIGTSAYNNTASNSKYVGYMYDTNTDSTIKGVIDAWYENNILESYEGYISNEVFCNDTSVGSTSGTTTYFGAYTRLSTNKTPSLECTNVSDRYTLKISGQSNITGVSGAGNNMLDYPIGLLTGDEASLAGFRFNNVMSGNSRNYLSADSSYWLGSPNSYASSTANIQTIPYVSYGWGNIGSSSVSGSMGVRPVINLKPNVKYSSGSGLENDPYTVQEIQTPIITLNTQDVYTNNSTTFTVTVESGGVASIAGTLLVSSRDTSVATVSPANTNLTATTAGVSTTVTVTGIDIGDTSISVRFIPTDTTNYNYATKTYSFSVTGINQCLSGDSLSNCLVYNDYGARDYNAAITAIGNKTASDFSSISTTYEGLKSIADYSSISSSTLDGTSYYYRGAANNNWVSFAGYLWRIVRINGDGSVRLIYSGTTSNHTGTDTQIGTSYYNSYTSYPKYVGYTYDNNGTETNSTIKGVVDGWYATNIRPSYEGYISNEIFCNDRINTISSYNTYYGAYTRLITNKAPSLECANQSDRYTLKESGNSSIPGVSGAGNNILDYPIGLLTADEVSLAGGKASTTNSSYYLYTGQGYYLGSPYYFYSDRSIAYVFGVNYNGYLTSTNVTGSQGVRPVINLKSTIKYDSGNGTVNNPYTVKL